MKKFLAAASEKVHGYLFTFELIKAEGISTNFPLVFRLGTCDRLVETEVCA
jgi:hypothetical protein